MCRPVESADMRWFSIRLVCQLRPRSNAWRHLEGRGFDIRARLKGLAGQGVRSHSAQRASEEAPFQRVVAFESSQEFAFDLPANRYTLVGVGDKGGAVTHEALLTFFGILVAVLAKRSKLYLLGLD
jgi:hypothetical protein